MSIEALQERQRCTEIVRQALAAASYAMGLAQMDPRFMTIINELSETIIGAIQSGEPVS
jgi:hypothetical protein